MAPVDRGAGVGMRQRGLGPVDQLIEAEAQLLLPAPPAQPAALLHDQCLHLGVGAKGIGLHQPAAGLEGREVVIRPVALIQPVWCFSLEIEAQLPLLQGRE